MVEVKEEDGRWLVLNDGYEVADFGSMAQAIIYADHVNKYQD